MALSTTNLINPYIFLFTSIYLSIYLSISVWSFISIYLSIHLSISISVSRILLHNALVGFPRINKI